jgi:catechol 2,3-dioxygenase-like lactoylglutathione lyase family enzyme
MANAEPKARFLVTHPVLEVADVVEAAEFYERSLGFVFQRFWGDPPCFVMLFRGAIQIFLRGRRSGAKQFIKKPYNECEGWDVFIRVDDVDVLHRELQATGVEIAREPETTTYKMREMEFRTSMDTSSASRRECQGRVVEVGVGGLSRASTATQERAE